MNLRFAFALGACVSTSSAWAQYPDLVDLNAQYMPGVPISGQPTLGQVTSYDGTLNVPIPLGEKSFLIPGLGYHVESVSYANEPPDFAKLGAFHAADLALLFVQLLPRDWSLSLRVAPGLAGDFQKVDQEMLRFSAMALATQAFSDRLVLGGGILASYGFGVFLPLPALYVDWKPVDVFQLEAFLPAWAHLKFLIANRIEIGARAEVNGNSYAVRDERIAGRWPCADEASRAAQPELCFDHIAYSTGTAGALLGIRLYETVWLTAYGGRSFYRRFEPFNAQNQPVNGGPENFEDVYFFRAGMTWRIPRG